MGDTVNDRWSDSSTCWIHNREEPVTGTSFLVCGECGHVYPTARSLRHAFRRQEWMGWRHFNLGLPWWRVLWRMVSVRASEIPICMECIHDF